MRKITRTLTVIGSAVALTFAGTGVASATSNPAPGDIWDISSRFLNPNYDAERELRDAAANYAARSVGPTGTRSIDHVARDRAFPGGFVNVSPHVAGAQWNRNGTNPRFVHFRVEKNNRTPLVERLRNAGWFNEPHQNGRNYGIHVTTSGDFHHVTVAFQR